MDIIPTTIIGASPLYGLIVVYLIARSGMLTFFGATILWTAVLFGSFGVGYSIDLLTGGTFNELRVLTWLAAGTAFVVAALATAAALGGWRATGRRLLLGAAALLLPLSMVPLMPGSGLILVLLGWGIYITAVINNPPLRASESLPASPTPT